MRLSTRWNILLLTVLPITVIYVVIFGISIVQMQRRTRAEVETRMTQLASYYASQFDGNLRQAAQIAQTTATFVETHPGISEEQVYAQLRANVGRNELVYGAALAFDRNSYEGRELFSPYVFRGDDGLEQIEIGAEAYDYTDPQWQWWSAPRDAGRGIWTEPYFDEGAGNILMSTYSVPFYREGKFWGVTTIDIPLAPLNEKVGIEQVRDLDFFIVSPAGRFIFHADPDRIVKDTIFDVAERLDRPDVAELGRQLTSGEAGVTRIPDWNSDGHQWCFYAPISSTGWGFAARISEHEALADARTQITWTAGVLLVSLGLIIASIWFVSGLIARAQEQLRVQGAALETAANAIVITDRSGAMLWVNPAFAALTGYDRKAIVGANPRVLKSGRHRADFYRNLWKTITAGEIWHGEIINRRADGTLYDEEMTITPVPDAAGNISHYIAIKQDVTRRKRTEEEIVKAREEAEEANRSKSAFLANMSHEIRTPMNGIMGMTDLALDTELSGEQRDYLTTVKSSAESLLTLLNDILDFSKIEAGKLELDPIDFQLRNGLADTLNTLAVRAHARNLELAYDVPSDVPDALVGDIHRLRQVIVNLVGNAIKFTEKGEVVVGVSLEPAPDDDNNGGGVCLHFSVTDTGVGIPQEKLQAIFSPFEQADTSTTRQFGGTGLGLAISMQLIEMMRGRIWVDSELGRGSTFHFTARFGIGEAPSGEAVETKLGDLKDLPVLVVDDNRTNRRILKEMLKNWGMVPTVVEGAADALKALDQARNAGKPLALVVSDVNMPGMDGFELVERIKQSSLHREVPVILLTSASRTGDSARCRRLGVFAHLMKPVKQSSLLDAIATAVVGGLVADKLRPQTDRDDDDAAGEQRILRVLLAEDNAVNQKFAVRVLQKRGHGVEVAGNGVEAVAAWEKESFDVVLMDVQMPEMDGFEATATIRRSEADSGTRTPIVAMTAHAMKGDRERCLEAGMDGYVTKPVKASTLFAEIQRVLAEENKGGQAGHGTP